MEKLSTYLRDNQQSYRQFAKSVPMSASFLSEILADEADKRKSPSLRLALDIQSATGGEVTVADWPKLALIGQAFQNVSPSLPPKGGIA